MEMSPIINMQMLFPAIYPDMATRVLPLYANSPNQDIQNYRKMTTGAYVIVSAPDVGIWHYHLQKFLPPNERKTDYVNCARKLIKMMGVNYNDPQELMDAMRQDLSSSEAFPIEADGMLWLNHQMYMIFENGKPLIPYDEVYVAWLPAGVVPKPICKFTNVIHTKEHEGFSFEWQQLLPTPTPEARSRYEENKKTYEMVESMRSNASANQELVTALRESSGDAKDAAILDLIGRLTKTIDALQAKFGEPEPEKPKGKG